MRKLCALLLMTVLLLTVSVLGCHAEERKLTLMVYMCGSNLESAYGSASADIQEMLGAGLQGREVTVLIMTGGSTNWSTGFDASQTMISELGPRGTRVVWRTDAMNMGEPETLTQLLRYGMESYPAQDYALIMWNHGGGPLEGVCWDELFSMDKLSLEELSLAIAEAKMPQKLSWIGFDACLMSSLEVASAMAPHAEYMVASQETEPAFGWNYSFLAGLKDDANGLETGRRIVDSYFQGHEDTQEVLTLACLDLSKAAAAEEALDGFFAPLRDKADSALFTVVSGVRTNATGFGKSVRGYGDDGYDLVDLVDLTNRLDGIAGDAAELQAALGELVCYSRTNIDAAGGVSVYHPYVNKEKYLTHWKTSYPTLQFAEGYSEYVRTFGDWLTGSALVDWSGLTPYEAGRDAQGRQQLAVQLSQEQAFEFSSAQVMILRQNVIAENTYSLIGVIPAEMDANGCVSALAAWKSLYILDSNGVMNGPVSYETTVDGTQLVRHVLFEKAEDAFLLNPTQALYFLETDEETNSVDIVQFRVLDEATGSFTNRIPLDSTAYQSMYLYEFDYMQPEPDEHGVLPAAWPWERDSEWFSLRTIDLSGEWAFVLRDDVLLDDTLLAVFVITDAQQNLYASLPFELEIPTRVPYEVTSGTVVADGYQADLSGHVSLAENERGLYLELVVTNLTDCESQFSFDSVVLNAERYVEDMEGYGGKLKPHETKTLSCFIDGTQMVMLDDIEMITVNMTYYEEVSTYESTEIEMTFSVANCCVAAAQPQMEVLAETEKDGVVWKLMDISPNSVTGFDMVFYMQNNQNRKFTISTFSSAPLINSIGVSGGYMPFVEIPAGCSSIVQVRAANDAKTDYYGGFSVTGVADIVHEFVLSQNVLQAYGENEIREVTLMLGYSGFEHVATLTLKAPWPIPEFQQKASNTYTKLYRLTDAEQVSREEMLELVSNSLYTAWLERIMIGEGQVAMCLHLTNHSNQQQVLETEGITFYFANSSHAYGYGDTIIVPAHGTAVICLQEGSGLFDDPLPEMQLYGLGLEIRSAVGTDTVRINLNEPARFATPGGVKCLPHQLSLEGTGTEPARTVPVTPTAEPLPESDMLSDKIVYPENAGQYRQWITAPLTEDQRAQVESGFMVIAQQVAEGHINVICYQSICFNEQGEVGAETIGLKLSSTNAPEALIPYVLKTDGDDFTLNNVMNIPIIGAGDGNSYDTTLTDILVRLTDGQNTAVLERFTVEDGLRWRAERNLSAIAYTYELVYTPSETEPIPHAGDMEMLSDFDWYLSCPSVPMFDAPMTLQLCPITAEDDLYVMFSLVNQDGTGYSLPLFPYVPAGN